jgi:hypothetical protein
MSGGNWAAMLGAALGTGQQTFNKLSLQEEDQKRYEAERQAALAQQQFQNDQLLDQKRIAEEQRKIAAADRQRKILDSAITNANPGQNLPAELVQQIRTSTPDLMARLSVTPEKFTVNAREGLDHMWDKQVGPAATYTPEQVSRQATVDEQVTQQKLTDAQATSQARQDFLSGKGLGGTSLTPDQQNRLQSTWLFPQVNANEVFGPLKAGGQGGQPGLAAAYTEERQHRVGAAAKEALDMVDWTTTGPAGLLTFIPGLPPANFQAKLDTLKANIGFQELNEMRAASKTGGALGQVAVEELHMLQSVLGSLKQTQSPDQLRQTLQNIIARTEAWEATKQKYGWSPDPQTPAGNAPAAGAADSQDAAETTPGKGGATPSPAQAPTRTAPPNGQRPRISDLQARYGDKWREAAAQFRARGITLIADVPLTMDGNGVYQNAAVAQPPIPFMKNH